MQNVATTQSPAESVPAAARDGAAPADQPLQGGNLILRNDTILGVCQGIGEEFGFHPNWLRVPIASLVMINWMAAFGIYFALGLALLVARLVYPRRTSAAQPATPQKETAAVSADNSQEELSVAA